MKNNRHKTAVCMHQKPTEAMSDLIKDSEKSSGSSGKIIKIDIMGA